MNVEEAVRVAKKIGAKVNVPNHCGMFASNTEDPEKFTGRLKNGIVMEFDKEYGIGTKEFVVLTPPAMKHIAVTPTFIT